MRVVTVVVTMVVTVLAVLQSCQFGSHGDDVKCVDDERDEIGVQVCGDD